MSIKNIFSTLAFMMLAAGQSESLYSGEPRVRTRKMRRPTEKEKNLHRETKNLQEFNVKGTTILAYSKKDAIKRFNHQFKKK